MYSYVVVYYTEVSTLHGKKSKGNKSASVTKYKDTVSALYFYFIVYYEDQINKGGFVFGLPVETISFLHIFI